MRILDVIAGVSFVAAVPAFLFLVWQWSTYAARRRVSFPSLRFQVPVPIISVLLFAIPIFVIMTAVDASQHIARYQILNQLDALKDRDHVSINGKPVDNSNDMIAALKKLDWLPAHHSQPTKRLVVDIPGYSLWVCRDSDNPREYWVFYPRYFITRRNEVGRIVTPLFDAY